jgi:hypothetical protein
LWFVFKWVDLLMAKLTRTLLAALGKYVAVNLRKSRYQVK